MREKGDFWAKQERDYHDQHQLSLAPSSSRRWSAFRNPRIVRVSRAFGGKDRHSKVCTVRGLRDRRIRLSVPTAVQLYELQDKLGVSQPSKVIDWLIDATKDEIDKLPPLQMPPGFGGFPLVSPELFGAQRSSLAPFFDMSSSTTSTLFKHGLIDPPLLSSGKNEIDINESFERSKYWDINDAARAKGKELVENRESHPEKTKYDELHFPGSINVLQLPNISSNHSLSISHQHGSQFGFGFVPQNDHLNLYTNVDSNNTAPSLSLSSSIHHNPPCFPPSAPAVAHIFPPYNNATAHHPLVVENSFQLFSSGQSFVPALHLFGSSVGRRS